VGQQPLVIDRNFGTADEPWIRRGLRFDRTRGDTFLLPINVPTGPTVKFSLSMTFAPAATLSTNENRYILGFDPNAADTFYVQERGDNQLRISVGTGGINVTQTVFAQSYVPDAVIPLLVSFDGAAKALKVSVDAGATIATPTIPSGACAMNQPTWSLGGAKTATGNTLPASFDLFDFQVGNFDIFAAGSADMLATERQFFRDAFRIGA
jgi:hypothetical protein